MPSESKLINSKFIARTSTLPKNCTIFSNTYKPSFTPLQTVSNTSKSFPPLFRTLHHPNSSETSTNRKNPASPHLTSQNPFEFTQDLPNSHLAEHDTHVSLIRGGPLSTVASRRVGSGHSDLPVRFPCHRASYQDWAIAVEGAPVSVASPATLIVD